MNIPSPLIQVNNLFLNYLDNNELALKNANLVVYENEFLAIVGPSGCGKSSLLNILGTLQQPTSGEILYKGDAYNNINNFSDFRRKYIGFIFQSFHLISTLTALENVLVPVLANGPTTTTQLVKAQKLLFELHLEHRANHLPSELSGGERQRVAIARALINDPELILADEPSGSLDSRHSIQVIELLHHIQKEHGVTVVVATHDPIVSKAAKRTIHMLDGQIKSEVQ